MSLDASTILANLILDALLGAGAACAIDLAFPASTEALQKWSSAMLVELGSLAVVLHGSSVGTRFGGEEFCSWRPGADRKGACRVTLHARAHSIDSYASNDLTPLRARINSILYASISGCCGRLNFTETSA